MRKIHKKKTIRTPRKVKKQSRLFFWFLLVAFFGTALVVVNARTHIVSQVLATRTVSVATDTQLTSALANAQAGDIIILQDGTYTGTGFTVSAKNGTSSSRIIIKAQNRQKAIISGTAYLHIKDSSYVTIEGLLFTNTGNPSVRLTSSHHVIVTRNIFRQAETGSATSSIHWIYISGSTAGSHSIERNLFENKKDIGNFISIAGLAPAVSQNNIIRYNHFKNIDSSKHNAGKEAIRVGTSNLATSNGYAIIESNLFESCSGDFEVISIKSGRNTIRNNTFRNNNGSIVLRHGNENTVSGNFFLGGQGGIRVYGKAQRIYNNYIEKTTGGGDYLGALLIPNGDAESTQTGVIQDIYERPRDIIVAFNTLVNNTKSLEIGGTVSGTLAAQNLTIANNIIIGSEGKLVNIITNPISATWAGNIMFPTGSATLGVTMPTSAIRVTNPLFRTTNSLQKLYTTSPAVNSATGTSLYGFVTKDMDGQSRTGVFDVGADELSSQTITVKPLTATMVGPSLP